MNKSLVIETAKVVITIVDRLKTDFYVDVISGFDANIQMVVFGQGTATTSTLELLGLNNAKGIIFSIVKESRIEELLQTLEEKFKTIKHGKGVCATIPISSVIGASLYQFMINNRKEGVLDEK